MCVFQLKASEIMLGQYCSPSDWLQVLHVQTQSVKGLWEFENRTLARI